MATYQFSALSDGQALSFSPSADVLNFDQSAIAAADIRVTASGASTRIDVIAGPHAGKDILLLNTSPSQLATANVTFADGSRLLIGDSLPGTGDEAGNTLAGSAGRDLILGLGGSDTINIGAASFGAGDHIDGGAGFDTLNFNGYVTAALAVDFVAGTIASSAGSATFTGIERLIGGAGNDSIAGDAAGQNLTSVGGNDTLWGAGGVDTLWSGTGADVFLFREVGTANADTIGDFASGADRIVLDGAVLGGLGPAGTFAAADPRFWAAAGATGGHDADDRVVYNTTTRQLFYDADGNGAGAAQLIATLQSGATLAATDIEIIGSSLPPPPPAPIVGTEGNDSLVGSSGNDTIEGRGGNDTIDGAAGRDTLDGGVGADSFRIAQAPAADLSNLDQYVAFESGLDKLRFDGRAFTQLGLSGNFAVGDERFHAAPGATSGHDATDRLIYDTSTGRLYYDPDGSGTAAPIPIADLYDRAGAPSALAASDIALDNGSAPPPSGQVINGTAAGETLAGTAGTDIINAFGGSDTINIGAASFGAGDAIDGGAGFDTLSFSGYVTAALSVDFAAGTIASSAGSATFTGIERLIGGAGNDSIAGDAAGQNLTSVGGNDTLWGAGGVDTLWSGTGADVFLFREVGTANADTIGDFTSGADRIVLDGAVLAGLGTAGTFAPGDARFWAAAGASGGHDADDRVVYNTTTRQLFYDADGSGAGAAQLIATLQSGATLAATDIEILGSSVPPPPAPIVGTEGNDSLVGTSGNDTIEGRGGNDTLDGAAGADTLDGGAGGDLYLVDNAGDVVVELQNGGIDTVQASLSYALGAWVENLTLTGAAPIAATGNALDNVLIGNGAANTLDGGLGNDTYHAGAGDVLLDAGGTDTVLSGVTWTLGAAFEHLTLTGAGAIDGHGNALANAIQGNGATNVLDGGAGNDTLNGAAGADAFLFHETGAANADTIGDFTSGADRIALDGAALSGLGAAGTFAAGDARFWSAAGATGGHDADDRIVYNTTTRQLFYDVDGSGSGTAQLLATLQSGATLAATDIEVIGLSAPVPIVGTEGNDSLAGTSGNDTLEGRGGNDTLDGAAGADTMDGGAGGDLYLVDNAGDVVVELQNGGIDTVHASLSYTLGSWVENLTLTGGAALAATGNGLDNVITGNGAANTLDGALGNDTYHAGVGDVLFDAGGTDTVVSDVTWTLGAAFENLILTGAAAIHGHGNALANAIQGNGAANVLDGGGGADTLTGGAGGDLYLVGEAGDVVVEQQSGGIDTVQASLSYTLSSWVENLTLIGTAPINATGNELDNVLTGNGAANVLDGGGGADTLDGGAGADLYLVDSTADVVVELQSGGVDTVNAALSYTLGSWVENLTLTGTAPINATGNELDNVLVGNSAANSMDGGLGNDTYHAGSGDVLLDAGGADTVVSNVTWTLGGAFENLSLTGAAAIDGQGNALANAIQGNGGANVLAGGAGNDTLNGGAGADAFLFRESGAANADTIGDFASGSDRIVLDGAALSGLGAAGTFAAGDARFWSAAGATGGHDADDRIVYNTTTRQLFYDVDGSGSGTAQLLATLQSGATLAATDIEVIGLSAPVPIVGTEGNDSLVGTSGNDTIEGRGGNDTLDGAAGADTLDGGAGGDLYLVDNAGDVVVELQNGGVDTVNASLSYTLGLWVENLTLTGAAPIAATGNALDNVLIGNGAANTLDGGLGNDTYHAGAGDVLLDAGGTDMVLSGVTWTLGAAFEHLTLTGGAAIDGHGNALANAIQGNGAANVLDGGGGADTLTGDAGADMYVVDNTGDIVVEQQNGGVDTVNASLSYTLSSWVENLTLIGIAPINATGNELDNVLIGNGAANTLDGGLGNDTYHAGAGDVLLDAGGTDTVLSGVTWTLGAAFEHLTLTGAAAIDGHGNALANAIQGNGAANVLEGGAGNDTLNGGAGADAFLFRESGVANADTIGDFASGADRIVLDGAALSGLGAAGSFAAGDARFWSAAGATGGHDADDRIVYNTTTRQLFYDADGSGSGAAQLLATLQSGATLAATDIAVEGGAPPPDSGVRTVVNNGASANRIDIVVLGDGYTAGQLATDYTSDVDALVAYLFDDSPLSQPLGRYESFFNVYAVDVASNESGADQGGVNRDTALGAQYSGGSVTLTIDEAAANAVLAGALQGTGIQAEMRFVAVNDARYGGSGGSFAIYSAANSWAPEIALHEAGHHFADLADQYWSPGQRYSGTEPDHPDVTADPAAAKWSRWLGYDEVGIPAVGVYEGGFNYETGIYRPSDTSKMQALGQPFDAVGREAFILEFYALVDPLDGHLGNAQALSNTDELWVDTIDPQIIRVDWTINGTTYSNAGERISLSALGLSNGDYTVSARAYDPTDWVRVADRSSLEQTVEWRVINDTAPRIVGTAANDLLVGGSGNDSLDGGLGADTMNGGLGNDVYVVTAGDVVGDIGGIDTAVSDISWSLGAASGLDNLTLTGTAPIAGQGNSGDNRLLGNGAANTLDGGEGNDAIAGGDGNDVVRVDLTATAAYGDDTVDGGGGNDAIVFVGQRSATVLDLRARTLSGGGQSGAGSIAIWSIETFNFSVEMSFADRVIAGDLGIQASTGGGDDTLVGGAGVDVWQGGPGADSFAFVRASAAVDTILDFTSGQDELHFDSAAFTGIGASGRLAAGDQRFHAASGATQGHDATDRFVYDTATGNLRYDADGSGPAPAQLVATFSGNAAISATDIVVRLNGTSGRDTLDGGSSDDELHGGADQDFFRFRLGSGDYGHDVIDGGPGVDHLDFTGYAQSAVVVDLRAGTLQGGGPGGAGSASLESIEAVRGGSFDDLLIAPEASEFGGAAFSGGGGNDTLVGGASRDALWGDAGDDQLFGNGGNDQLDGGRGADQILAGAGDDLILVYDFEPAVIDRIDGGPGRDQVQFHAARASLTVNLATGTATVGTSTFMLADVEDIIGPEYASQMTGNAAGNFLAGGGGADTLHGGPGNDTLLGGGGADSFLFAEASGSANADLIPDFAPGSDRIRLDDAAFTGIGATGGFVAGDARFAAGAGFTAGRDASDRVVYDTATGNLYYDADGSGAGAAQLIATFTGNPGIAATDIVVI